MLLGTDPEFFILDPQGKVIPAHRFFPGKDSKKELRSKDLQLWEGRANGTGHPVKYFRDGHALELNPPGTHCRQLMFSDVMVGMKGALRDLPAGYSLSTNPLVTIDLYEDLKDAPEDCLQFGCDPSWNAYTLEEGRIDLDARSFPFRSAGGHMHFSTFETYANPYYNNPRYGQQPKFVKTPEGEKVILSREDLPLLIKMFDQWIGLTHAYILPRKETFLRREFYGKAGEYRIQKYPSQANFPTDAVFRGVEYRVLGSDLYNSKALASLCFGLGRSIIQSFYELKKKWDPKREEAIREAVNTGVGMEELLLPYTGYYSLDDLKKVKAAFSSRIETCTWFEDGNDWQYPIPKDLADYTHRSENGLNIAYPSFSEGWYEFQNRVAANAPNPFFRPLYDEEEEMDEEAA